MPVKYLYELDEDNEGFERQLDPDCELAAAHGQIALLEARIKELESRPRLDVDAVHLHKLTSKIKKLEIELSASKQNEQLIHTHLMKRSAMVSDLNDEMQKVNLRNDEYYGEIQRLDLKYREGQTEIGNLRKALEWYTEKGNMERYIGTAEHHDPVRGHWFSCWMTSPATDVARKALGMKTETEELLHGRSNNKR